MVKIDVAKTSDTQVRVDNASSKNSDADHVQIKLNLNNECARWIDGQRILGESKTMCIQRLLMLAYSDRAVLERQANESLASDVVKLSKSIDRIGAQTTEISANSRYASNKIVERLEMIAKDLSQVRKIESASENRFARAAEHTMLILFGIIIRQALG